MIVARTRALRSRGGAVASTTVVNFTMLAVGVITGVITAQAFEPSERGVFLGVVLWSGTIAAFALMGLDHALIYAAQGDGRRANRLSAGLRRRVTGQTTVGAVLCLVVNLYLTRNSGALGYVLAVVGLLPVVLNGLTQMRLAPLLIAGRFTAWNLVRLASPVAYLLVLGTLHAIGRLTLLTALSAVALGGFASLVIAVCTSSKAEGAVVENADIRHIVKYGRQLLLVTVPAFLAARADQLLMGVLAAPATLGVYAVAVSVASVVDVPKQTIEQLAFPHFARTGWRRREVWLQGAGLTLIAALGCVLLLLAARPLVPRIYGADYAPAIDPLPWLLGAAALRVGAVFMGAAAKAAGQIRMLAKSQAASLAVTMGALVTLMPWVGAVGAAAAVLAGQTAYSLSVIRGLAADGLVDPREGTASG